MDSVKLNKEGVVFIKFELEKIGVIKDKVEIYLLIVEMQKRGMYLYFILYVSVDDMNSNENMVYIM